MVAAKVVPALKSPLSSPKKVVPPVTAPIVTVPPPVVTPVIAPVGDSEEDKKKARAIRFGLTLDPPKLAAELKAKANEGKKAAKIAADKSDRGGLIVSVRYMALCRSSKN